MINKKTTHVRVDKSMHDLRMQLFPEYKDQEIYKLGFTVLKRIDGINNVIYGKPKKK